MTGREPRISFDFDDEQDTPDDFVDSKPKHVFHPFRREIENSMVFKVDPELARRRAEDIAQFVQQDTVKPVVDVAPEPAKQPKKKPTRRFRAPKYVAQLTETEISATVDRLSQPTKTARTVDSDAYPLPKRRGNAQTGDAVFARLFTDSTEQQDRRRSNSESWAASERLATERGETDGLTRSLGEQKKLEIITEIIGERDQIDYEELEELFRVLGVIESCESLDGVPVIKGTLSEWELPNGKFDLNQIKEALFDALKGKRGRFECFVKNRIGIHFANMRFLGDYGGDAPTIKSPKKRLTKETFERLLLPKPDFGSEKVEEEEEVYEPIPMCQGTIHILKKSPYAREPMEERTMHLRELAVTRAMELATGMLELEKKAKKKKRIPKLTEEEREEVDECRQRRQIEMYQYHPFKPHTMKYKDFLKVKHAMEDAEKPKGWDENIRRHRVGYQRYLAKKKKESRGILELPKVRKRRLELVKLQEESPPPPPPPPPPEEEPPKAQKRRAKKQTSPPQKSKPSPQAKPKSPTKRSKK